jgi:DNA-binding transcriptional regulator YdaS (Cro superfamily)
MTRTDLHAVLEAAINERNDLATGQGGAAKIAALLGISESRMSSYRKGTYAAPHTIDPIVREILGGETVSCPEMRGEITLAECAANRRRKPTTDSFYARLYRACKRCQNNGGNP